MTRLAAWLLSAGVLLFVGLLISQGLPAVLSTLALAGWGLLLVALFHGLPLLLDAAAIRVLFEPVGRRASLTDALLARWAGESVNSLLPAGQIGGPVLMVRHLSQRGMPASEAAAAITVSTTFQTLAQVLFAVLGVGLLGARASHAVLTGLRMPLLVACGVLGVLLGLFYLLQRRGLFGRILRLAARLFGKRDWTQLQHRADAIDEAVQQSYRHPGRIWASFLLSWLGWLVGTGEVYLALHLIGQPVSWSDALLLESLGQAIRGAAFAIPGSLGVQEGGYLLLAPLVGLSPEVALALSLAKRAREMLLGLPGLLYLHLSERGSRRRGLAVLPQGD